MIGQSISHYHVTEKLGAGGMGEVYRATDSRLNRDVALKVLPTQFAQDAQRMARFEREAQLLAALNHANIAAIYGLEQTNGARALVMELVEGPTLAGRIAQGALPLDEALPIATQIAEALEYAHERGIIHRDLKPANIKLTPSGDVKLLDFGLAKALDDSPASQDISDSPTLSMAATKAGLILGTAAYMSPEQARGRPADKRADIFAFGSVLFEMLSGKRAFTGETASDTLAAVLRAEPEWQALPENISPPIRKLLRRCLEKNPRDRLRDIGDARSELRAAQSSDTQPLFPAADAVSGGVRRWLPWAIAALMTTTAIVAVWQSNRPAAPPAKNVLRFSVAMADPHWLASGTRAALAISPDGKSLVFVGTGSGNTQLFLRSMAQGTVTPIPGTEGGFSPFFSPDSQSIAFYAGAELKKLALAGGKPVRLIEARNTIGGAWGEDGSIIIPAEWARLTRIFPDGKSEVLLEKSTTGDICLWPSFLPGSRAVLLAQWNLQRADAVPNVMVLELDKRDAKPRLLVEDASFPHYSPTGHLVFNRQGTLFAVGFDPRRLEVSGTPVNLGIAVNVNPLSSNYSFSPDGTLVVAPGMGTDERILVWVDHSGAAKRLVGQNHPFVDPNISPDGQRVALALQGVNQDVWVYDVPRGTLSRVTHDDRVEVAPVWSHDGTRLTYGVGSNLLWKSADGTGEDEVIWKGATETSGPSDAQSNREIYGAPHPYSWSSDGTELLFTVLSRVSRDIWLLRLKAAGQAAGAEARPLVATPFVDRHPQFSPNDKWIAYASNESGRSEVYVHAFEGSGRWQISSDGGEEPRWSRDGRALFYRSGNKMMAVDVRIAPDFSAGKPRQLFEVEYENRGGVIDYAVSADGKRFVMIQATRGTEATRLEFVVNWLEELRRLSNVK